MSVYKIFPETAVTGTTIDINGMQTVTNSLCRRYCDDTPECQGFKSINDEECILYSKINSFYPSKDGSEFYLKAGSPSYWPLWILMIGTLTILFLNQCK